MPTEDKTLEEAIKLLDNADKLFHVTLSKSQGRWQAASKSISGGYSISIQDCPVAALKTAIGPGYGITWEDEVGAEVVKEALSAEKDEDIEDILG